MPMVPFQALRCLEAKRLTIAQQTAGFQVSELTPG